MILGAPMSWSSMHGTTHTGQYPFWLLQQVMDQCPHKYLTKLDAFREIHSKCGLPAETERKKVDYTHAFNRMKASQVLDRYFRPWYAVYELINGPNAPHSMEAAYRHALRRVPVVTKVTDPPTTP